MLCFAFNLVAQDAIIKTTKGYIEGTFNPKQKWPNT